MATIFAVSTLEEYFRQSPYISPGWAFFLAAFIHAFLLINFFAVAPLVFIWLERKVSGRIQDRLGPTRVGGRFGWLQTLADGIKLIQKEDLVPGEADKVLFRLSPLMVCVAAFSALLVLPFADGWAAQILDVGAFLIFALLSLEVVGVILAGYSSGSKWALFGSIREAAQMVSYEIPLAICALIPIVAVGSLNLNEIAQMQSGAVWNWMIFHDPFTFIAFFVFFTVATAGCKRAPFDLAEAESELVGGFHTEYSGLRWSFFFMAEYSSMFVVSGIAVILFLGGWHIGIDFGLLAALRGWAPALPNFVPESFVLGNYIANVIGAAVFIAKGSLLVFVQIWVRWTLPRLRIDQVMTTCLKYLIPISCFLFLGAIFWPLLLGAATGNTHWGRPMGERIPLTTTAQPTQTVPFATDNGQAVNLETSPESRVAATSEGGVR
jgi:NADH-quinone oxidoreductase subunit H